MNQDWAMACAALCTVIDGGDYRTMRSVAEIIASKHKVTLRDMRGRGRTHPIIRARHEAIRACCDGLGKSQSEVGRFLNLDHSTVNYVMRKDKRL